MNKEHQTSASDQLKTKWTWYLFLLANVLLLLGLAITWILYVKIFPIQLVILPIVIFSLVGTIVMIIFYWLESKELVLVKRHVNSKWFKYYLIAGLIYIIAILMTLILVFIDIYQIPDWFKLSMFIIIFVFSFLLSLISIGLYRYGRFRIDLDLYRRKRGEEEKQLKLHDLKRKKHQEISKNDYQKIKNQDEKSSNIKEIASSGLTDKIEKENHE